MGPRVQAALLLAAFCSVLILGVYGDEVTAAGVRIAAFIHIW
jgi:hypothetical protein